MNFGQVAQVEQVSIRRLANENQRYYDNCNNVAENEKLYIALHHLLLLLLGSSRFLCVYFTIHYCG